MAGASSTARTIKEAVEPLVAHHNLFLEDVVIAKAGKYSKIQVVVDKESGPGGVNVDDLAHVTQDISQWCDLNDPLGSAYNLEVTTPGIDRKLTQWRHFSRAQGRKVRIELRDDNDTVLEGVIENVGDTTLEIDTGTSRLTIAIDKINSGKMIVEL
ncbi:MAG: ribosome maturation factor RimP [Actinomycetaceae bacterium]|nr:ribosome maturation factor RimP [Actinomycetaceae bacterium]